MLERNDNDEKPFVAMYLPIHETAMRLKRRRDDEEHENDEEGIDRYLHTRDYDSTVQKRTDRIFVRINNDEGAKAAKWQRIPGEIRAGRRHITSNRQDFEQISRPDELLVKVRSFTAREKELFREVWPKTLYEHLESLLFTKVSDKEIAKDKYLRFLLIQSHLKIILLELTTSLM